MTEQEIDEALAAAYGVTADDLNLQIKKTVVERLTVSAPVMVQRVKAKRPSNKLDKSYKRDLLERAEYENLFPACKTKNRTLVASLVEAGATLDELAFAMVEDYCDLKNGLYRTLPKVETAVWEQYGEPLTRPIGCESKPAFMGNWFHAVNEEQKLNRNEAIEEAIKWKQSRTAKQGQRPQVLLQA